MAYFSLYQLLVEKWINVKCSMPISSQEIYAATQQIINITQQKQLSISLFIPLMKQSLSLDELTTQFMSNAQMEELSPNDRKFILTQLKKMYSEQMGKVASELTRRNQVKNNKHQLQHQEEMEIKSIQQNIVKKMQSHNQKRQKAFSQKLHHFKLLDQNWRLKLEEIQRKKKQQYRRSLEKAAQYRKQAETFWSFNRKKEKSMVIDNTVPIIQNEGYFSIRSQVKGTSNKLLKPYGQEIYQHKRKSHSKNQFPSTVKSLLPTIEKRHYFLSKRGNNNDDQKPQMHQSFHKLVDDKTIQQHIEKSKNLNTQKQALALQKALQKMRQIQLKRKKCKLDRQKNIKQAKIKRQLRQQTIAQAQKSRRQEQGYPVKSSKQKRTERKSIESQDYTLYRSCSKKQGSLSLKQSIVKHLKAKQELEAEKFQERGEVLKANIMKQKKGKMIRMVKETINKLKCQALKDS